MASNARVELPMNQQVAAESLDDEPATDESAVAEVTPKTSTASTVAPSTEKPVPAPTEAITEAKALQAPSSPAQAAKPAGRPAVPALPVVPVLPKATSKDPKITGATADKPTDAESTTIAPAASDVPTEEQPATAPAVDVPPAAPAAPAWSRPKQWAGLFGQGATSGASAAASQASSVQGAPNGDSHGNAATPGAEAPVAGAFTRSNTTSLAEALRSYRVNGGDKIAFLEPRGLINTGNMCYMNSVSIPSLVTLRLAHD